MVDTYYNKVISFLSDLPELLSKIGLERYITAFQEQEVGTNSLHQKPISVMLEIGSTDLRVEKREISCVNSSREI